MGVGIGATVTALIGGIGAAVDYTEKTGRYHPYVLHSDVLFRSGV